MDVVVSGRFRTAGDRDRGFVSLALVVEDLDDVGVWSKVRLVSMR